MIHKISLSEILTNKYVRPINYTAIARIKNNIAITININIQQTIHQPMIKWLILKNTLTCSLDSTMFSKTSEVEHGR